METNNSTQRSRSRASEYLRIIDSLDRFPSLPSTSVAGNNGDSSDGELEVEGEDGNDEFKNEDHRTDDDYKDESDYDADNEDEVDDEEEAETENEIEAAVTGPTSEGTSIPVPAAASPAATATISNPSVFQTASVPNTFTPINPPRPPIITGVPSTIQQTPTYPLSVRIKFTEVRKRVSGLQPDDVLRYTAIYTTNGTGIARSIPGVVRFVREDETNKKEAAVFAMREPNGWRDLPGEHTGPKELGEAIKKRIAECDGVLAPGKTAGWKDIDVLRGPLERRWGTLHGFRHAMALAENMIPPGAD